MGVRVAVVDSGVEDGHPLVGRVAAGGVVVADDDAPAGARFEQGPHDDLFGHGTACAGLIRRLHRSATSTACACSASG